MAEIDTGGQRTTLWRQARAGCVTGSGFADVLAFGRGGKELAARANYRMQLIVERLTGNAKENITAAALEWGKEHEDHAIALYEMRHEVLVEKSDFVQDDANEWIGVSPDGLVGENGMIEVKCPANSLNHVLTIIHGTQALSNALLGKGETSPIPEEHMPQVQGNLWVLKREWCDFISYDPRMPEHLRLYVRRVPRDEAYIQRLAEATEKFLEEVQDGYTLLMEP